jgi:hypothetical protein
MAYKVYILPVLSFLVQFRTPDKEVLEAEEAALRMMTPGPYRWCLPADLYTLADNYGQALNFPNLMCVSTAAKCRVLHFENYRRGGLDIQNKALEVGRAARFSEQPLERQMRWGPWFDDGLLKNVVAAEASLELQGLSVANLMEASGGRTDPEESGAVRFRRVRKKFQGTVTKALHSKIQAEPIARMRSKLARWSLRGLPGKTAHVFLRSLLRVKHHFPPKVSSAVLRTAWNGWCTRRRFQKSGPCLFGCNSFMQGDSLEHYAGCIVCVRFLRKHLHYQRPIDRGHLVALAANSGTHSDEDIVRLAVWAFTLYKTFNHLRTRQGPTLSAEDLESFMTTVMWEAVQGHELTARYLRNCWDANARLSAQDLDSSDDVGFLD